MSNPFRSRTCIVCSAQKGQINHWWLLQVREAMLPCEGLSNIRTISQLCITEWKEALAVDETQHPACGNSCTQIATERFLQTGSLEPQRVAANPNPSEPPPGETTA